jgi:cell division protease FtsH
MMAVAMGGRAAEVIIFNKITSGAADDIRRVTQVARSMVCELGMSEKLGPLKFGKREEMIFLGKEISQQKDYSERTAELIDEEVRGLVNGAYERALGILRENLQRLHTLAQALLEREILDRNDIARLLNDEEPPKQEAAGPPPAAAPVTDPAAPPAEARPESERLKPSPGPAPA